MHTTHLPYLASVLKRRKTRLSADGTSITVLVLHYTALSSSFLYRCSSPTPVVPHRYRITTTELSLQSTRPPALWWR